MRTPHWLYIVNLFVEPPTRPRNPGLSKQLTRYWEPVQASACEAPIFAQRAMTSVPSVGAQIVPDYRENRARLILMQQVHGERARGKQTDRQAYKASPVRLHSSR